jgi:DNA-binding SARP family transcriptional activator
MLELRVVGHPQALNAGRELKFSTRKGMALLVYLALEPRLHARDQLMRLLWPASLGGRGPLRTALTHLNRTLEGCAARIGGDAHAVRLEGAWSVDLNPSVPGAQALFLEGFSLVDAPEFDDWVTARRDQLSLEHRTALQRRLDLALQAGDTVTAVELARAQVKRDPLDEAGYRTLIELHVRRDEHALALEMFNTLSSVLHRELQTQPSTATAALLRAPHDNAQTLREARAFVVRGDPVAALNVLLNRADEQSHAGLVRDAAQLLESALGIGLSAAARTQVLTRLSVIRAELNQDALVATSVEALMQASSSAAQRAEALSGLAMSLTAQGRLGDAERTCVQATGLVSVSGDGRLTGEVAFRFMLLKYFQGEFALVDGFLAPLTAGLEAGAEPSVRDRVALADVSVLHALALIGLNRFAESLMRLQRAQTLSEAFPVGTLARDHVALGWLLYHRATHAAPHALGLLQHGLARKDFHFAALARGELAQALLDADQPEAALEQIQALLIEDHPLGLCMGQAALARLQHALGLDSTAILAEAQRSVERTDAPVVRACVALACLNYGNIDQQRDAEGVLAALDDARLPPQWRRLPEPT